MLLEKYSGSLMATAMRYMKDEAKAKDVLQESWIKIFKALAKYKDSDKLLSWLKTIVINTSLSALRSQKATIISIDQHDSNKLKCDASIESAINMKDLMKVIAEIPSPGREVFMMNILDGLSHKEIAGQMNISESTSRVHLTNARKYLRKVFSESKELKSWIGSR